MKKRESGDNPEYLHKFEAARHFEQEGRSLHAMQLYMRLLEDYPLESGAPIALSALYDKSGKIDNAKSVLLNALTGNPDNIVLRLYAGHYYFKLEEWDRTIDILSRFIPEQEPIALFFTAYAYFMLDNLKLSKHYFLLYIKLKEPHDYLRDAYIYLAKIFIRLENYETALDYVKKADAMFSGHFEVHFLFAIAYYHLEMYTHALADIDKAHKLDRGNLQVIEWAGKITLKLGDYKKAEKHLRKYIEHVEDANADTYTALGTACMFNKKTKEAEQFFNTALRIEPKHPGALSGSKRLKTDYVTFER
jgi:tetratricopeptide (TPR) repeat protein